MKYFRIRIHSKKWKYVITIIMLKEVKFKKKSIIVGTVYYLHVYTTSLNSFITKKDVLTYNQTIFHN